MKRGMFVMMAVLLAAPVFGQCADTFCLTSYYDGITFNFFETEEIYLDINVSVAEARVMYSDNAHTISPPFLKFSMDSATGVINFTTDNSDVGMTQWITVIIENRSNEVDDLTFKMRFNISNINDPPYIISASPGNVAILEDSSLLLNVTIGDPDFPYGDTIWYNWTLNGNLSPKLVFSGNRSVYTVGLNDFDVGVNTIRMEAYDSGGLGVNYSWTITVENRNINPLFILPVGNLTMDEDTVLLNNFSLDDHFSDADVDADNRDVDTGIQLVYGVENAVEGEPVWAIFTFNNTDGTVSVSLPQDWFGNQTLYYTVFDGYVTNRSNNFSLEVRPVNDPPIIWNAYNVSVYANLPFNYTVNATDVDNEILYYFSDSLLFTIDNLTGVMNGTPRDFHVGDHLVNITVSDGLLNVSRIFNITVMPNAVPLIFDVPDQSVVQHSTIFINVSAFDAQNDTLFFECDLPLFEGGDRVNETLVTYNITPILQSLIGNHTVRVTVIDDKGTTNYTEFNLEIIDFQMPPVLAPLNPFYEIRVGKVFNLDLEAFDEDGNIDSFSTNHSNFSTVTTSTGSWIENAQGYLSYSPVAPTDVPFAVNVSVNDTTRLSDSQIILVNVTPNRKPVFTFIQDILCEENKLCPVGFDRFEGYDPDWQDTVVFGSNSTMFNITPGGIISFVPNMPRFEGVAISLTDGELTAWYNITVNITFINDPPFFDPPLANMSEWNNIWQDSPVNFNITAYDEENATCNFHVVFLNFTDLGGNVSYTGIDLFEIVNYGNTTVNNTIGGIMFTPNWSQTGRYWVNISVDDGELITSEIFSFRVRNINNPPIATWQFTNGTFTTSAQTSLFALENTSFAIDVTAFDPDYDPLYYTWIHEKGGVRRNIWFEEDIMYQVSFHDAPGFNLTLSIMDEIGASTNITWSFIVSNVNRLHMFGRMEDDYFRGTYTNTSNSSGLVLAGSGSYPSQGVFLSQIFDMSETNSGLDRFRFATLDVVAAVPAGSSFVIETRSREQGAEAVFSDWEALGADGSVLSPSRRYWQYRAILNSNGVSTPTIRKVGLNYEIANISGVEAGEQLGWINIENFFMDHDLDDTYTYRAYTTSLDFYLNVSVGEHNFIHLTYNNRGTEYINFSCTDQYNNTVWSNRVRVDISPRQTDTNPEQIILPMPSSGGGTVVQYRTRTVPVKEYVSMDLIHPENVTIYENDIMVIPVTVMNNGNETLKDLTFSAYSENDLPLMLSSETLQELGPGEIETFTITANLTEVYGSFQVVVRVDVEDPGYTDSAKVTVNSLKKGLAERDLFEVKFAFAQDLLEGNPQCLELTEFLSRARESFISNDVAGSMSLVDTFINDCRFLISKQAELQIPMNVNRPLFSDAFADNKSLVNVAIMVSFVILFFAGYLIYVKYRSV